MKEAKTSNHKSKNGSESKNKKINRTIFKEKLFEKAYFDTSTNLPTKFSASFYTTST